MVSRMRQDLVWVVENPILVALVLGVAISSGVCTGFKEGGREVGTFLLKCGPGGGAGALRAGIHSPARVD